MRVDELGRAGSSGVDPFCVRRRNQGRGGAVAIALVALGELIGDLCPADARVTHRRELGPAPLGANLRGGVEEELERRLRHHAGPDVAPLEHAAMLAPRAPVARRPAQSEPRDGPQGVTSRAPPRRCGYVARPERLRAGSRFARRARRAPRGRARPARPGAPSPAALDRALARGSRARARGTSRRCRGRARQAAPATRRATVLLPTPAGPSMATTRRGEVTASGGAGWSARSLDELSSGACRGARSLGGPLPGAWRAGTDELGPRPAARSGLGCGRAVARRRTWSSALGQLAQVARAQAWYRVSGPIATRRSFCTGCPIRKNISRICRVRPSESSTANQLLPPSRRGCRCPSVARLDAAGRGAPPLEHDALAQPVELRHRRGSPSPSPRRSCGSRSADAPERCANSPSSVSSSRPSV